MRFWFRVPVWYKYTVLVSYTFIAMMILEKPLPPTGLGLSVYILLALGALTIFRMWNSMIGVDTQERVVIYKKRKIPIDDIVGIDYGLFKMSVLFRLRNGSGFVFPYPIEDRDQFEKLVGELLGAKRLEG